MPHPAFSPNTAAAVRFARVALRVRVAGLGEDRPARAAAVLAAAVPPASWRWSVDRAARPRHRLEHLVPFAGGKCLQWAQAV